MSILSEADLWTDEDFTEFSYSRRPDKQNMLIFLIEDVAISENLYSDATAEFIHENVERAKLYFIGLSVALILFNFIFVLILIFLTVVKPVTELTDQIMNR